MPATTFLTAPNACFLALSFSLSLLAVFFAAFFLARAIFGASFFINTERLRRCVLSRASKLLSTSSDRMSISVTTSSFIFFSRLSKIVSETLANFLGRPDLKALRLPDATAARILLADIPDTPSASGSLSPADTT